MQQSDNVVCSILILIALPFGLAAAKKAPRDWKTGKLADSTVDKSERIAGASTRARTIGSVTRANTSVQTVTALTVTLMIVGDDYAYTAWNRRHGCRFIVGEDIKYAQEKDHLYVVDVDGKECKLDILRQEKREQSPSPAK